eukprot:gnl/TRDRNA2_/TRDRNA2_87007_c0_seq1.p1 gnl/TRDRNA2_/TRDRNA2_87007_c0~~gnl/TRDRNA2_/TRDRNA2_87007_c0_seq1.p1  ORF type:complete len:113 (+),score=6.90 gnl/TRDRNA2_/TRDRNA2_87007_c0_seq1:110-448(+)
MLTVRGNPWLCRSYIPRATVYFAALALESRRELPMKISAVNSLMKPIVTPPVSAQPVRTANSSGDSCCMPRITNRHQPPEIFSAHGRLLPLSISPQTVIHPYHWRCHRETDN